MSAFRSESAGLRERCSRLALPPFVPFVGGADASRRAGRLAIGEYGPYAGGVVGVGDTMSTDRQISGEFIEALQQIAKEKDIPLDTLIETVESALATAYKRNFPANA